jgi:hypothetical protein
MKLLQISLGAIASIGLDSVVQADFDISNPAHPASPLNPENVKNFEGIPDWAKYCIIGCGIGFVGLVVMYPTISEKIKKWHYQRKI